MTRKEELEKIIADAQRELDTLPVVKFREGEILFDHVEGDYFRCNLHLTGKDYRKLTLEELVLSLAPAEAVRWDMSSCIRVNFHSVKEERIDYIIVSNHVRTNDWMDRGGKL
jgi:hypothetical protein